MKKSTTKKTSKPKKTKRRSISKTVVTQKSQTSKEEVAFNWGLMLSSAILTISILVVGLSAVYYFSTGDNLLYGDARSHLNIARRVFDSTNPGFAQLGGIWLPLLHGLMLPFIWNDFLWHSGLAGALINVPAFILGVFFLFKIGQLLFKRNLFIQFLIPFLYLINPNFIYLSSTAMTETLFITTFTGSIYFLLKWLKYQSRKDVVWASFFFLLTSINRYEGWSLVLAGAVVVFIGSLILHQEYPKAEGQGILFSTLAFSGIFGWLGWQLIIFRDPFYFLHSIYSSQFQTSSQYAAGTVSTFYRNLPASFSGYLHAISYNAGALITIVGLACFCLLSLYVLLNLKKLPKISTYFVLPVLITPLLFLSYAIYKGNVPLEIPEITGGSFNIRLGMYMLPSCVILILLFLKLIPRKIVATGLLLILLLAQFFLFYKTFFSPITLVAAHEGIEAKIAAAHWLQINYQGGKVLASSATGDPLLFDSGLKLSEFITDGSDKLFLATLANPTEYASYIIFTNTPVDKSRDLVSIKLSETNTIRQRYTQVFNNSAFEILKRNSP